MRFTAHRADLAKALAVITKALPRSARRPEDAGVTLTVSDGAVTLRATDYDLWAEAGLDAMIGSTDGTVVVPGHILADWVTNERAELLGIGVTDAGIECRGKRTLVVPPLRVEVLDGTGVSFRAAHTLTLVDTPGGAEVLADALKRVAKCVGSDALEPIFTGVHLEYRYDDGRLQLTTTDRYKIARVLVKATEMSPDFAATPPLRRFAELVGALRGDLVVTDDAGGGRLAVAGQRAAFAVSTIFGEWPKLDHLITRGAQPRVTTVNARRLRDEVAGVAQIAARMSDAKFVRVRVEASGRELLVSAGDPDGGTRLDGQLAGEPMECEGDDWQQSFNAAYLLDALGVLATDGDIVIGHHGTAPRPCLLAPVDADNASVATVMPMR